jgi:hypothetical protein
MVIIFRSLAVFSLIFITSCGGGGGMGGDSSSGGGYGNMNTAPTITITTLNISVQEKQTSAFTLTATDSNGDSLPFSGSGDDSSLMSITDAGVVTFNAALDFEVPSNANASNVSMIVAAE